MKKHSIKALALTLPLVGSALTSPATFAAVSDYHIDYTGGSKLSNNVVEDTTILDNLTPIIPNSPNTSFTNGQTKSWSVAYYRENDARCKKTHYVVVNKNQQIGNDGLAFTLTSNDGYSLNVRIKGIQTDNDNNVAIGVIDGTSAIHAGEPLYRTDQCTTGDEAVADGQLLVRNNNRVFVDMVATLKENGSAFNHDGVYMGITDIDAAQSYKIVGNSQFVKNKMITPSKEILDDNHIAPDPPAGTTINLDNYFATSSNGNYIYSQYVDSPNDGYYIQNPNGVNAAIYAPIQKSDLSSLNFIFGFGKGAGSRINLYVKQYNIKYISDDNGEVSGTSEEKIFIDGNPSGSETTPATGYTFSYWRANKTVILNGEEIEAGEPITDEELAQLTLTDDTTFKAIHEKGPAVPNTGEVISKELSGAVVPMSIAGIITLAIVLFYLPRINHKKVNFKKK